MCVCMCEEIFHIPHDAGSGKTMLMDIFYSSAHVAKKQRVHFNAFMLDVHNRKLLPLPPQSVMNLVCNH